MLFSGWEGCFGEHASRRCRVADTFAKDFFSIHESSPTDVRLDPHTFPPKQEKSRKAKQKQQTHIKIPKHFSEASPARSHRGKEPSDGEPAEDLPGGGFKGAVFTDVPCSGFRRVVWLDVSPVAKKDFMRGGYRDRFELYGVVC